MPLRSDYNERPNTRREGLAKRAQNAQGESSAAYEAANRFAKSRSFHQSERRVRADQRRIERSMLNDAGCQAARLVVSKLKATAL